MFDNAKTSIANHGILGYTKVPFRAGLGLAPGSSRQDAKRKEITLIHLLYLTDSLASTLCCSLLVPLVIWLVFLILIMATFFQSVYVLLLFMRLRLSLFLPLIPLSPQNSLGKTLQLHKGTPLLVLIQTLVLMIHVSEFSRQGFGRGGNNKNTNNNARMNNGSPTQTPSPQAPQGTSSNPNSPGLMPNSPVEPPLNDADAPKYFFQEKYAPLNVRGNFLTLCACPKNVELGEWLAHQSR